MATEQSNINCPTFQKQEPAMKRFTDKINMAKNLGEKIKHAEGLLKEVNVLLNCSEYEQGDVGCENCRTIANLRKETAELIIKAKKLI